MTQQQAVNILKTGANVFLTGEPGSGKTHTINEYVKYLKEYGVEPSITASTGIAATHIGGSTLHSWSGIGIKKDLSDFDIDFIASKEYVFRKINKSKILIIDEISMLDASTLESADRVCRAVKRSPLPFGGMQVILVGDFFQLPPINQKRPRVESEENTLFHIEEKGTEFAFMSRTWSELNPIICYLSEQHRQDDAKFLTVLSAIRRNDFDQEHFEHIEDRIGDHNKENSEVTKLFAHNEDVDRINSKHLSKISGSEKIFETTSQGPAKLVESLKRGCLSPEKLVLKIGAKVMFTKNNMQEGFVNGSLGKIESFDRESGYPIVRLHNRGRVEAVPMDWTLEENGLVKARISQVPLRLAWAITIHKSQGMSMDAALVDLSQVFEYGQGYVALSRVRRLSGLFLLGVNPKAFMVHPTILEKDFEFRELSREAVSAFGDIEQGELEKMHVNFISACGGIKQKTKLSTKTRKTGEKGLKTNIKDKKATGALTEIRKTHPNAYAPWSKEEESDLKEKFQEGSDVKALAKQFGRKIGGIKSRLIKLGLIEE